MENDRKFLFDVNIFDAPPKEEPAEDLPPPPPTFSEDELAAAKDMAFEQGRQAGQKEQQDSREQYIAQTLDVIAQNFSKLFAAETVRESIFEKESLKLGIMMLDLLFPLLNEKLGHDEVYAVLEKTLSNHKKTKEIVISVPAGCKGEVEALIARLRADEHEAVLWRVVEKEELLAGDCALEWGDGGAVRDSLKAAKTIRNSMEEMLGAPQPLAQALGDSEADKTIVLSKDLDESAGADVPKTTGD